MLCVAATAGNAAAGTASHLRQESWPRQKTSSGRLPGRCSRVRAARVAAPLVLAVNADPTPDTELDTMKSSREGLEEKYAVIDSGKWACTSCGYVYDQDKGDSNYPVSPGIEFQKLPEDWTCPTCGSAPSSFSSLGREVAGFVQNQSYGLGTNSMTSAQKSLLIWGSLGFAFMLFLSGYFLE